jgi:hypothetical protein
VTKVRLLESRHGSLMRGVTNLYGTVTCFIILKFNCCDAVRTFITSSVIRICVVVLEVGSAGYEMPCYYEAWKFSTVFTKSLPL